MIEPPWGIALLVALGESAARPRERVGGVTFARIASGLNCLGGEPGASESPSI